MFVEIFQKIHNFFWKASCNGQRNALCIHEINTTNSRNHNNLCVFTVTLITEFNNGFWQTNRERLVTGKQYYLLIEIFQKIHNFFWKASCNGQKNALCIHEINTTNSRNHNNSRVFIVVLINRAQHRFLIYKHKKFWSQKNGLLLINHTFRKLQWLLQKNIMLAI